MASTADALASRGKTSLDPNEARDMGAYRVLGCSGISWTICKQSAPRSRQTTSQYLITQFLQAGCSSQFPTNSVKTLKIEGNVLCLINMQVLSRLRVGELTKHNVVKCCLWPWGDSIAANRNNKTVRNGIVTFRITGIGIFQKKYTQQRFELLIANNRPEQAYL